MSVSGLEQCVEWLDTRVLDYQKANAYIISTWWDSRRGITLEAIGS